MTSNNTNPSPNVLLNGNTPPYILPSGGTMTVSLASSAGVSLWSITCVGVDDVTGVAGQASINAQLQASINRSTNTATFTVPSNSTNGSAVILQSTVNNGIDSQSIQQPSYTTTCKTGCLSAEGGPIYAMGETTQGGPFGWLPGVNNAARSSTSVGNFPVGIAAGGDLSGTYPNPSVSALAGLPITGTPTPGHVLGTDGSHAVWVAQTGGGGGGGSAATYQVTSLLSVPPSSGSETVFVDGYSAQGDGGAGYFTWNAAYHGPATPITVVPDGYATGAWIRVNDNIYNPLHFGAKGDGVTDDTAAIQSTINAMYPAASGTLHFAGLSTTGLTSYLTSQPLFLGGSQFKVECDTNVQIKQGNWHGPVFASMLPFDNPPTFGTESGLTYVTLPPNTYYNLAYTPINNLNNWGDGYQTYTTAPFIMPSQLGSVTIAVHDTSSYPHSTRAIYIQGAGIFFVTAVVDGTHLTVEYIQQCLSSDVTSGTIASGTGVSGASTSIYTGPTPGFTFEAFVDPVTDWPVGQPDGIIISSSGAYGSNPTNTSMTVSFYNDQGSPQTRLKFLLQLGGSNHIILSTTHTITAGSLTHIAATYDGYSTMSLYIAGTRVATASISGIISQQWEELMCLGMINGSTYPGLIAEGSTQQPIKLAGVALHPIAKYFGTSFTPPTTVSSTISRLSSSVIDFANQVTVTGPNGSDFGKGWVQALSPQPTVNPEVGMPTWLQLGSADPINYCYGPLMTNVNISQFSGDGIFTYASLYGIYDNCYTTGGTRGITLDGFSYRNRISNCSCSQLYASFADTGINQYSWNFGIMSGSQYAIIDGGYAQGAAWNLVSNVYAGIHIRNLWLETTGLGGFLLNGEGSPAATIHDCFFQSDEGIGAVLAPVAALYAYSIQNLVIEGGYLAATFVNPAPQLVVDTCANVIVNGSWIASGIESGNVQSLTKFINQTLPVFINTTQAGVPWTIPSVFTTFHPINGSASVAANNTVVLVVSGSYITFNCQPNTLYVAEAVDSSTGTVTLNVPYSGTSTVGAIITLQGYPWQPEDGYSGQGPLLIGNQENFGFNTVNMINASGMTMLINDFLWGTIKFTDVDALLSGTVQVTLPLIAGYHRSFINVTGHTLTLGGASGTTVTCTTSGSVRMVCDGANWLSV